MKIMNDKSESFPIKLLEEKLAVKYEKRKVGEVVVRKEVETILVEVPVRREKLIVEQVKPHYEKLAEINLSQTEFTNGLQVKGEFSSLKSVIELLTAIANQQGDDFQEFSKIKVEMTLKDLKSQSMCQRLFEQYSS